ncbi:Inositol phosphophingolipids phospholipase C [Rhodotorula toruloides ATCC 204091]|uniref:Inositol phosphophingolipids phospholipase C n=2 Tax=Rhodotorula toruloides TaxID=5286 RepID=A0A2T0A507_RHOTO|nr:Inositol phosphophingolipids phospholipase C [Rhodotorula toruloides ATCC 204091]PRQ73104.1 inositol phosphophingolipids phospholipase C [Rhodotorula toruloides]
MQGQSQKRLRVLSLNCWGLWLVADKRRQRIEAIADWIAHSSSPLAASSYSSERHAGGIEEQGEVGEGYDVVALQELWVRSDYEHVAERAKEAGLVHSRFFYSGAIGSGLAILSRHPIVSAFVSPYPLNGFPLHFIEGDFFAGKAVCGVCVDVEGVGKVDVLNTHMYAPGGEGDTITGAHRVAQAWELARIATEKAERGRHVLVMGDFNSQPHSLIMRLITTNGSLLDSFAETHPPPPSITSAAHRALSPVEAMHAHGITCDSPLNTYSAPKLRKKRSGDEVVLRGGKRLDYILYRSPADSPWQLRAESTSLELTEPIPSLGVSYSDHFALSTTFSFTQQQQRLPDPLTPDLLSPALSNLHGAYRASLASSRFQLRMFLGCIAAALGLTVASSFEPLRALNWLFTLLGVVAGAGGATFLYTGFLGGSWEAGQLRNVITEMEAELQRIRIARVDERGSVEMDDGGWTR